MFPAFHQQFCLHASVTGDYAWAENYRRAAIYSRVGFFFLSICRQILCRQLLAPGVALVVGGSSSTGGFGNCRTGGLFRSFGGFALSWMIEFVQWVSHVIIATWVMEVNSSQLGAAQLCLFKWSNAAHHQNLLMFLLLLATKSFWFPRWVDLDILDVSSQVCCWLCHQVAASDTEYRGYFISSVRY